MIMFKMIMMNMKKNKKDTMMMMLFRSPKGYVGWKMMQWGRLVIRHGDMIRGTVAISTASTGVFSSATLASQNIPGWHVTLESYYPAW